MSKHFPNNLLDLFSFTSEALFCVDIYRDTLKYRYTSTYRDTHIQWGWGGSPTANSLPSLSHWMVLVAEQWKQSMVGELR